MPRDHIHIEGGPDLALDWSDNSDNAIFDVTHALVGAFEDLLQKQTGLEVTHEWDDGLVIQPYFGSCVKGCDDCGSHEWDGDRIEKELTMKGRLMLDALECLVPLYLDASRNG